MSDDIQPKTLHELYLDLGSILASDSSLGDAEVFLPDPRERTLQSVIPLTEVLVEDRRFCESREGGIRRSISGKNVYLRSFRDIDPDEPGS